VVAVAALVGVSCSSSGGGVQDGRPAPSAPQISGIEVRVSAAVVLVGHPEPLALTVTYQDGSTAPAEKALWTTDDSAVADVDSRGVLHPRANGMVTIRAAIGNATGSRRVRVAPDYGGSWEGLYHVTECEGAHCSPHSSPERFQPFDAAFRMTLTQEGTRVSGQLALGKDDGVVFCDLAGDGSLQFDGMYRPQDLSWKEVYLWEWHSRVEGNRLLGTLRYGEPEDLQLRAELTSIVRR
jgi:Bacterial Ig-like domain (group 2)